MPKQLDSDEKRSALLNKVGERRQIHRAKYEAALGRFILQFNDLETFVISAIADAFPDDAKSAVGLLISTLSFIQRVEALLALCELNGRDSEDLKMLADALKAVAQFRNIVAHSPLTLLSMSDRQWRLEKNRRSSSRGQKMLLAASPELLGSYTTLAGHLTVPLILVIGELKSKQRSRSPLIVAGQNRNDMLPGFIAELKKTYAATQKLHKKLRWQP